jgi:phosphopantetheinyl transferase (holo-ACP synthase)
MTGAWRRPARLIPRLRHRHRHLRRAPHPRFAGTAWRALRPKILARRARHLERAQRALAGPRRRYLATRFSAKEAFSKAIGMGMRMPMTWRSCEIGKLPSGKPVIVLHGELKDWFEARQPHGPRHRHRRNRLRRQLRGGGTNSPDPTPDFHERARTLILDIAGLAHRGRPPPPGAPAGGRHDPVWPQLERPRAAVRLCAEIKDMREDLLICVDHEGGRVQRFRTDGFTHLPPMRELGELWMKDRWPRPMRATAAGYVLGAELRACGVDFSFTPVLDLDLRGAA